MIVLSLFDGISCGQQALKELGINVKKYYASEIKKQAIKCTMTNHPETKQLGDVRKISGYDFGTVDLLMGGSPCQGFSSAGKGLNFDDPRSKLFFEFVRIKNELQPKYFFLENVNMKKEWRDIITEFMGVEPICIDSALVSAQRRVRWYWTNIPGLCQPEDRGILLKDILVKDYDWNIGKIVGRRLNSEGHREDYNKNIPLVQCLEIKSNNDKSACLSTVDKDNVLSAMPPGRYPDIYNHGDYVDRDKALTLWGSDYKGTNLNGYLKKAYRQIVFRDEETYQQLTGKKFLTEEEVNKAKVSYSGKVWKTGNRMGNMQFPESTDRKAKCLVATNITGNRAVNHIEDSFNGEKKYRKLTTVECERLQGLPDGYTSVLSDSAAYEALGNGWQVDTIKHIFKNIEDW